MGFFRSVRRPHAFVGLVLFWNALLIGGFASQLSLSTQSASLAAFLAEGAFFSSLVIDVLLVGSAGAVLVNGKLPLRLVAYCIFLVQFLGDVLQLAAHYLTGQFLSRLAIENANHVTLLLSPRRFTAAAVAVAAALSVPLLTEIARNAVPRRQARSLSFAMLSLAAVVAVVPRALPEEARRIRDELYEGNNITERSPLVSLIEVLVGTPAENPGAFTPADALAARRYGFEISLSSDYPLRKDWIYREDPPFAKEPGAPRRPNIIVFFTEGISARLTGPYGSPFPGITPNLDRFAARPGTMVVENYYNHTFATYRGLHGQLCSFFPKDEGSEAWLEGPENAGIRSYFSLADYFRELGYETDFLDTHRRAFARVDDMMRRLGFENVWTAEDLSTRYLGGAQPLRSDALSDHQLLEALVGFLEERQERGAGSRPFFVSLYNIETHAFQDSAADGPRYGDGKNHSLNTVHNLDDAFGRFLDFFFRSPLAESTVVVFTTDHCHYPTRTYEEAIRPHFPDLPRILVDAIPLIIYSPVHRLPATFDAEYRTSLDFAPSLIQLLGLPQRPNPFLGRSIFSSRSRHDEGPGIAVIGLDAFLVDRNGIARRGHPRGYAKELWRVQRLMRYLADLEENNRIWPGPGAGTPAIERAVHGPIRPPRAKTRWERPPWRISPSRPISTAPMPSEPRGARISYGSGRVPNGRLTGRSWIIVRGLADGGKGS
jgi:lipoteichoic acid synthase